MPRSSAWTRRSSVHAFQFWIGKNRDEGRNFRDGRWWSLNSLTALATLFPYWTLNQVRRVLDSLLKQKVLVREQFEKGTLDRRGWYAFTDEQRFLTQQATERRVDFHTSMCEKPHDDVLEPTPRRVETPTSCTEQLSTAVSNKEPRRSRPRMRPPSRPPPHPPKPKPRFGLTEAQVEAFTLYTGHAPARSEVAGYLVALDRVPDATDADLVAGGHRGRKWWKEHHGASPPANRLDSLVIGIGEAIVARQQAAAEAAKPPPPPKPIPLCYQSLEDRFAYSEKMRAFFHGTDSA